MTLDPNDDEPFAPGETFGGYQILERIGRGGMASVWRAVHLGLRKHVAIKVLRVQAARARFLQEGEVIARIRHAHVVDVHDVGFVNDTPYLVMELLEGEDLRALFKRRGALSLTELTDLVVPVCAAVASAHDASVVHRDLKPGNIFLSDTPDRGTVPKVLDFGLSRFQDRASTAETRASVLMGTPRYMAPEQVLGPREADARSDQYALGVILYRGAVGEVPIDDPQPFELLRRVVNGEFLPPRALRPELPEAFETVVLTAMAKDPDRRFSSVRALGLALLPFASDRTRILYEQELSQIRRPSWVPTPLDPPMNLSDPTLPPVGESTVLLSQPDAPDALLASARAFLSKVPRAKALATAIALVLSALTFWWLSPSPPEASAPSALVATAPTLAPAAPPPPALPPPIAVQPLVVAPQVVSAPALAAPVAPAVPVLLAAPTVAAPSRRPRRVAGGVNAHDID